MDDPLATAARLAARHHGLLTISQARDVGLTAYRTRTLIRRGLLTPVGHRGYRLTGSPATDLQAVAAACMEVSGVASHSTAAALHGLPGFSLVHPIEVVVRHSRQSVRSTSARVHSTRWLPPDDQVIVGSIPTLSVPRTLLSLAAMVPRRLTEARVADAVEQAIRRGMADEPWLWWRLEKLRRSGRNGVTVLERVLIERADLGPTESWLERETLRVLRQAGLPLPSCQARIEQHGAFVARVDFTYEGTMAILEVNGHRFHSSRDQLRRDAARRRRLVALGFEVYDFTYDEVVREPHLLVATAKMILGRPAAA